MALTLFSPAKVNLFLRILRKREDGYHELASLFQAISLGDTITFSLSSSDILTINTPEVPCDRKNLILKAADFFRQRLGCSFGLRAHLEKKIPLEAGLGGGSSNAATTLYALNELHGRPFSFDELREMAGQIGADVSFFFSSGTAYCTGKGEKVQSMAPCDLPLTWIVKPLYGLSTPHIFRSLDLATCSEVAPEAMLKSFYQGKPLFHNDLEAPAMKMAPGLTHLKNKLQEAGFEKVLMTGSGTAFFCLKGTKPPILPGVSVFPVSSLQREKGGWYASGN